MSYDSDVAAGEAMQQLRQLGAGRHNCGFFKGWLKITETADGFDVLWTSHKGEHRPVGLFVRDPAMVAEFTAAGAKQVYKTALRLHPARTAAKEQDVVQKLIVRIGQAARLSGRARLPRVWAKSRFWAVVLLLAGCVVAVCGCYFLPSSTYLFVGAVAGGCLGAGWILLDGG